MTEPELTDEDIRARSQALDDAQETWEEVTYLHNPKMPCPECSGAGSIAGGSLGDICVRCMGMRVIDQPGTEPLTMPPFAELRAAITAYGNALADRALPAGHRGKRNLALPAASTVPAVEQLQQLRKDGVAKVRELAAGKPPGLVPGHLLAEPERPKGLAGEGDLGEYTDAEFTQMEDEATRRGRR